MRLSGRVEARPAGASVARFMHAKGRRRVDGLERVPNAMRERVVTGNLTIIEFI